LEQFLLNSDFRVIRNKVRVLEVMGIGSINERMIADANLELERLEIDNDEEVMDLGQLVNRGVITRDGFKYLVFRNIKNPENMQRIIDLRVRLGEREWPVIVTDSKLSGAENRTGNVAYLRVCRKYNYELQKADDMSQEGDYIWVDDVSVRDCNIDCRNVKIQE